MCSGLLLADARDGVIDDSPDVIDKRQALLSCNLIPCVRSNAPLLFLACISTAVTLMFVVGCIYFFFS